MIRDPLTPEQAQAMFDGLMASALTGTPPPTDTGLPAEVWDAIVNVAYAVHTGEPSADLVAVARDVFARHQ